jgi:tripartite-type tricarboxylate transporter receptor subunit TctC
MVLFAQRAGLQMTNISYRGNHPALTDVLAGHVPTMFSDVSDALPQIKSGGVRAIAVSSAKRLKQLPDVPTVAETFPGYSAMTWNGLMAPAGTPKPIIAKLATELERAGKDPKFSAALAKLGAEPLCDTPEEFATLIDHDIKTWRSALQAAGLAAK